MSDITRLDELHADVVREVGIDCDDVSIGLNYDQFCALAYREWPAVSAEIARLREFARSVRSGRDLTDIVNRDLWTNAALKTLAETKKAGD